MARIGPSLASGFASRFVESCAALALELEWMYPTRRIALLQRDMDYHDVVLGWFREVRWHPLETVRINVTRESCHSDLLEEYCQQAGLGDRPHLVIDSGFEGSVAKAVVDSVGGADLKARLLCCLGPDLPSSWYSVWTLDPGLSQQYQVRSFLEDHIERLPHRYDKAIGFERTAVGRILPIVPGTRDPEPVERVEAALRVAFEELVAGECLAAHEALVDQARSVMAMGRANVIVLLRTGLANRLSEQPAPVGTAPLLAALAGYGRECGVRVHVEPGVRVGDPLLPDGICIDAHEIEGLMRDGWDVIDSGVPDAAADGPQGCLLAVMADIERRTDHDRSTLVSDLLADCISVRGGRGLVRDVLEAGDRGFRDRVFHPSGIEALWQGTLVAAVPLSRPTQ